MQILTAFFSIKRSGGEGMKLTDAQEAEKLDPGEMVPELWKYSFLACSLPPFFPFLSSFLPSADVIQSLPHAQTLPGTKEMLTNK